MSKLSLEEKDELKEFTQTEIYNIIYKHLCHIYDEQVDRFTRISSEDKERLQLEKAKLEGMNTFLASYKQLKK